MRLDVARRTAERDGEPVQLTYVEFEILRSLMRSPGRVLSRRALLESVWDSADYREQRTIDVHIRHLREKLERDPSAPRADPHRARRRVPLRRMIRAALQRPGRLRMRLTVVAAASAALRAGGARGARPAVAAAQPRAVAHRSRCARACWRATSRALLAGVRADRRDAREPAGSPPRRSASARIAFFTVNGLSVEPTADSVARRAARRTRSGIVLETAQPAPQTPRPSRTSRAGARPC